MLSVLKFEEEHSTKRTGGAVTPKYSDC